MLNELSYFIIVEVFLPIWCRSFLTIIFEAIVASLFVNRAMIVRGMINDRLESMADRGWGNRLAGADRWTISDYLEQGPRAQQS